jgi:hypothetical protein
MSEEQAQPIPTLTFEGQLISPADAARTREGLMASPEFAKEALTDPEKQSRLAQLYLLSRGVQPSAPAATVKDVEQQTNDRMERDRLMHVESLRRSADGISEEQLHQIVNGRPIPAEEQKIAQRHLAALQKDRDFVRRYLDGDRQAALEMKLTSIAARGMPVGTLEQIRAWERQNPSPVRK